MAAPLWSQAEAFARELGACGFEGSFTRKSEKEPRVLVAAGRCRVCDEEIRAEASSVKQPMASALGQVAEPFRNHYHWHRARESLSRDSALVLLRRALGGLDHWEREELVSIFERMTAGFTPLPSTQVASPGGTGGTNA